MEFPVRFLVVCIVVIASLLGMAPARAEAITEPDAIAAVAVAALGGDSGTAEATVDPALRMAACGQPLQAVPTSARVVEVRCPDAPGWRLYVPVQVRRVAEVVVLTEPVRAGEPITADMLTVHRRDMAGEGNGFAAAAAVVGRVPRHAMAPGAALVEDDLAEGALLRRGDPVVLVSRFGGIEVRVAGRALGRASPGGAVSVENTQSRRIIRGRLVGDGIVEVLR
jgi:flagella basal body P-ring formation protein FlgA